MPECSSDCALGLARKNAIPIFLICGTFSVILGKVGYGMTAVGNTGVEHAFEKPWFTDWAMFVGMMMCLLSFFAQRWYTVSIKKQAPPEVSPKLYWVIAIPASLDMISTFMMNVGLLWIAPSIWQMLRGSIVIFTAILTATYRKKKLYSSGWTGVFIVVIALCIVAGSSLGSSMTSQKKDDDDPMQMVGSSSTSSSFSFIPKKPKHDSTEDATPLEMVLGIILVIAAQFMQALQTIIEEKLLHDVKAPAELIVGLEGAWGFALCSFITMPIAYFLPGEEGKGLHEDTIDSFYMIVQNPGLFGIMFAYVVVILLFNVYGMIITETTSAMTRNLLEPFRTAFIWATNVFIFYVISEQFGEELNWWSFMELGGFLVLTLGFFVYNGILKLSFLKYAPSEEEEEKPLLTSEGSIQQEQEIRV